MDKQMKDTRAGLHIKFENACNDSVTLKKFTIEEKSHAPFCNLIIRNNQGSSNLCKCYSAFDCSVEKEMQHSTEFWKLTAEFVNALNDSQTLVRELIVTSVESERPKFTGKLFNGFNYLMFTSWRG
jgi:hypothetical protein